MTQRTQVGIVGAGPAGLLLAHLLGRAGIDSFVIECRSREAIEGTIRAGVLEQGTVDLLIDSGVGERLRREGLAHHGFSLRFEGASYRIDLSGLAGGRHITVYPQQEVIKDLVAARLTSGAPLRFGVRQVQIRDIDSDTPVLEFTDDDGTHRLSCDFIAGCDGFHGVCRHAVASARRSEFVRTYPFGWLGVLVQAPPSSNELIYAHHARGFALVSTRSLTLQRLYVQCDPHDAIEAWPDARIWEELHARLRGGDGYAPIEGRIVQKNVVAMRSFVCEPLRFGRLFLAGDAAHIVPPTGAKGMNLAVADVCVLARAITAYCRGAGAELLDRYSDAALTRVWQVQQFSSWMTAMLHRFEQGDAFAERLQLAQLRATVASRAASTALAEAYVGLPLER